MFLLSDDAGRENDGLE